MPLVGLGTVAATTVAGFGPGLAVQTTDGSNELVIDRATADLATTGTLESCAAYFGYGKDIVEFDVDLTEGDAPGVLPAVGDGIEVVLVLANEAGDTLRCIPQEVGEEEWDEFWAAFPFPLPVPPTWPGAGHYIYPAIGNGIGTEITDFGEVTSVAFEVTSVEAPYTLVSPTTPTSLLAISTNPLDLVQGGGISPNLLAYLAQAASPAASNAVDAVAGECLLNASYSVPQSDDLNAGYEALLLLVFGEDAPPVPDPVACTNDGFPGIIDFLLGATPLADSLAAVQYVQTISIAAPVSPGPVPPGPQPTPDQPAAVTPRFTG
jgi:hypothetical protein